MAEPKAKKQKISEVTDVAGASRSMNETCMKIDLTKIKKEERRQFERSLRLAVSIQSIYGAKLCKIVQNCAEDIAAYLCMGGTHKHILYIYSYIIFQGLPPTLKLSDVVRGAMFTDGLPEVSPEQAGLMELFTHSVRKFPSTF